MIRVDFDPERLGDPLAGEFERWERRAERALRACLDEARESGRGPDVSTRAEVWRDFKRWLLQHFFFDKCAYCEGDLSAQTRGAAEHWRPKGGAGQLGPDDHPRPVEDADGKHGGYWWLAFAWQNLVPGCPSCNDHKGTMFPIEGERAFKPDLKLDLDQLDASEQPLLLHPHRGEDPRDHIGFLPTGEVFAKNGSKLGDHTIRVLRLDRYGLKNARSRHQQAACDAFLLTMSQDHPVDGDAFERRIEPYRRRHAKYSQAVQDALAPVLADYAARSRARFEAWFSEVLQP